MTYEEALKVLLETVRKQIEAAVKELSRRGG